MNNGYNGQMRSRVHRLQNWLVILAVVVVFLGVAAPASLIVFFNIQSDQTQLQVTCTILETQNNALLAIRQNGVIIRQISKDLGLPHKPPEPFVIPEIPPECEEVD